MELLLSVMCVTCIRLSTLGLQKYPCFIFFQGSGNTCSTGRQIHGSVDVFLSIQYAVAD